MYIQCLVSLMRLVSAIHFNSKATSTNDITCSCHIKDVEFVNQSCGNTTLYKPRGVRVRHCVHTVVHTWTHTHTHTCTRICTYAHSY